MWSVTCKRNSIIWARSCEMVDSELASSEEINFFQLCVIDLIKSSGDSTFKVWMLGRSGNCKNKSILKYEPFHMQLVATGFVGFQLIILT